MTPDPGPGPRARPAAIPAKLADRAPPGLGGTLGPLAFRAGLDRETDAFAVAGRRAVVHGEDAGIREVLAHPFRVAAGPRVVGAGPVAATVTPLGAERRLTVDGRPVTERIVASRDAPVVWMEWTADRATDLELEWTVAAQDPGPVPLAWRDGGRVVWLAPDPAAGPGSWAAFIFSAEPGLLHAPWDDAGELQVRARVTVPGGDGLRLAMVLARAGDDGDRLFRIAGRTAVALRARAGAADRLLKEGLRVTGSDPALGPALDRDRIDLALRPAEPVGPWTAQGLAAHGLDRLAAGDFDGARTILDFLLARVEDDGRTAARGVGPRVTGGDDPAAGAATLRLLARWLAWTGDLGAAGQRWPAALRLVEAGAARGAAARDLAVVAEELGDRENAEALRGARAPDGGPGGGAHARDGAPGVEARSADAGASNTGPALAPGDVVRRVVHGLLGAEPDAPRGRLVLRPRLEGERLQVRGLAVGTAAVAVAYRREGDRHRLEVRQERGGPPLQLVLEPELTGPRVTAARVDGEPAELDVVEVPMDGEDGTAAGTELAASGRRWRVPVQLVLDRPRTLDVDVAPG